MKVTIELDLDKDEDRECHAEMLAAHRVISVLHNIKDALRSRVKYGDYEPAVFAAYDEIYTLLCDNMVELQIPEGLV